MKIVLNKSKLRTIAQNTALLLGSSLLVFFLIEIGYRTLDPFPYFSEDEINVTQHGNLSQYDDELGWKGVPNGEAEFTTVNNSIWLAHNSEGYRDIEHKSENENKPSIVFLGDSFTWGYEVEFDEMFVNLIRNKLPSYEIYNLSHRGYGTDQQLLTFMRWYEDQPVELVVLMISDNDAEENGVSERYGKSKPYYQIVKKELELMGVPVPESEEWTKPSVEEAAPTSWKTTLNDFFLRSHFIHDINLRINLLMSSSKSSSVQHHYKPKEILITSRILEELKKEVESNGAELMVFFIPSKQEVEKLDNSPPYQVEIIELCQELDIEYYDLASDFQSTWPRAYYRYGTHWNVRGHEIASDAIYQYLAEKLIP